MCQLNKRSFTSEMISNKIQKKTRLSMLPFVLEVSSISPTEESLKKYQRSQLKHEKPLLLSHSFLPKSIGDTSLDSPLLVFLDWDDTLFPTSWLLAKKEIVSVLKKSKAYRSRLSSLDVIISTFFDDCSDSFLEEKKLFLSLQDKILDFFAQLQSLSLNMHISIVTCSKKQWIDFTLVYFLPKVASYLSTTTGVSIVSARDHYQSYYPVNAPKWKIETFTDVFTDFTQRHILNDSSEDPSIQGREKFNDIYDFQILSIGDSIAEKNALMKLKRSPFYSILTKSIQLIPSATIDIIMQELSYLTKTIHSAVQSTETCEHCFLQKDNQNLNYTKSNHVPS